MASLDSGKVSQLRNCIDACQEPYILAAIQNSSASTQSLPGVLGVMDWRLQGSISRLILRGALEPFTLIARKRRLGNAALILLRADSTEGLKKIPTMLKKLNIEKVCLAESTFSAEQRKQVEQHLHRATIAWTKLEELSE